MRIDPIEFEIFKNFFVSIAEEMGVTLCRTGFSPNIKERLDYSCAIYDAAGETIAQGDHLPVHLGAMPLSVKAAIDHVAMEPGDTVILNDPFRGGTHLPDITLVSPVFLTPSAKKPAFFVANRAHHSDVGGMSPGSMPLAREVFQEGLIIPPIKLVKRGRIDPEILALILANVRTPDEREGDLTAQIAANRVGEARLLDIVKRYGHDRVARYAALTQDYAERILRRTIAAIPDGSYEFSDALDNDGFSAARVNIRCAIRIARRLRRGRLHRHRSADLRRRQRESRHHPVGLALCLPLPRDGRRALQRRHLAAHPRHRACGHSRQRACIPRPSPAATSRPRSASPMSCSARWRRPCPNASPRPARAR